MELVDRLRALAQRKHAEFAARADLTACALTGSLPRGTVWPGSDLDFYGFWAQPDDSFEDGVTDEIYWEINIEPLDWLAKLDEASLSQPPEFSNEEFGDTPLEILWGAQVLFDRDGALDEAVRLVARLTSDHAWLKQRGENYVHYGQTCLTHLHTESPHRAILDARRIAIVYGVNAYWMKRGGLLSSAVRIPERLAEHPPIQALFRQIWNLTGQPGWDAFFTAYQTMPAAIREEADPDVFREILPAVQLGMADGGLCHFRFMAEGWLPLEVIDSLMGFEADLAAQKASVLQQTHDLLDQIARLR